MGANAPAADSLGDAADAGRTDMPAAVANEDAEPDGEREAGAKPPPSRKAGAGEASRDDGRDDGRWLSGASTGEAPICLADADADKVADAEAGVSLLLL